MIRVLKAIARLVIDFLPYSFVKPLVVKRERLKRKNSVRKDVKTISVANGIEMDVYYKNVEAIGSGPAISIYLDEREVLKFDCFGGGAGHYHVSQRNNLNRFTDRFQLPNGSRRDHLNRCLFELQQNITGFFQLSDIEQASEKNIDVAKLHNALQLTERHLSKYV